MNQRLQQFLAAENITQSEFADTISVARASVSHVLAGRNNPGYDFIKSISAHYPNLSLDWLINGKGKMYKSSAPEIPSEPVKLTKSESAESIFSDELFENDDIFGSVRENFSLKASKPIEDEVKPAVQKSEIQPVSELKSEVKPKNITRIVVFYDDGTFQELNK